MRCTGPLSPADVDALLAMPNLVHLTLSGLDAFPRALCALGTLRVLVIKASPHLAVLPDEIAELDALVELDLRETRIRTLPERMEARVRARLIFVWR